MDPEIELKIHKFLGEQFSKFLLWMMRDIAGEFPIKIRINLFFSRNDGKHTHMIEMEHFFPVEHHPAAEFAWLKYEKEKIVKEAADFMTNGPEDVDQTP
jgi:hypothetical protein